jgi:hypothetical protein
MKTRVSTKVRLFFQARFAVVWAFAQAIPSMPTSRLGGIILTPLKNHPHKLKTITDPVTSLPVLSAGPGAPVLRSKDVEEILANFP